MKPGSFSLQMNIKYANINLDIKFWVDGDKRIDKLITKLTTYKDYVVRTVDVLCEKRNWQRQRGGCVGVLSTKIFNDNENNHSNNGRNWNVKDENLWKDDWAHFIIVDILFNDFNPSDAKDFFQPGDSICEDEWWMMSVEWWRVIDNVAVRTFACLMNKVSFLWYQFPEFELAEPPDDWL